MSRLDGVEPVLFSIIGDTPVAAVPLSIEQIDLLVAAVEEMPASMEVLTLRVTLLKASVRLSFLAGKT